MREMAGDGGRWAGDGGRWREMAGDGREMAGDGREMARHEREMARDGGTYLPTYLSTYVSIAKKCHHPRILQESTPGTRNGESEPNLRNL